MNHELDQDYLMGRVRTSLAMARGAANSAARLIHLELAGRYSLAIARMAIEPPLALLRSLRSNDTSFYSNPQLLPPIAE